MILALATGHPAGADSLDGGPEHRIPPHQETAGAVVTLGRQRDWRLPLRCRSNRLRGSGRGLAGLDRWARHRIEAVSVTRARTSTRPGSTGVVAASAARAIDIIGRWMPGQRLLSVTVDGRRHIVQVRRAGRNWELQTHGATHKVQVLCPHVAELSRHMIAKVPPDLSRYLIAPMPGLLTKLDVAVGDKVEPGQPVAVMEAMKMENILRAPKAARPPSAVCGSTSRIARKSRKRRCGWRSSTHARALKRQSRAPDARWIASSRSKTHASRGSSSSGR